MSPQKKSLLLIVEQLENGLSYGLEHVLVYILGCIVDSVPCRTKTAWSICKVRHYVYARNLGNGLHIDMVIHQCDALLIGEELSITQIGCQVPYFLDNVACKVHAHLLVGEGSTTSAHHIQQDAILGAIAIGGGLLCPDLATQTDQGQSTWRAMGKG